MDKLQVAIPTFNRSEYLSTLLATIPNNLKVVVSDNGGLTEQYVKDRFPNAKFINQKDVLSVFKNWNSAVCTVDSEWVIIPSDDDVFLDNSFERIFTYLDKYPDKDMLVFGHKIVDEFNHYSKGWKFDKELEFKSPTGYDLFKYGVSARMPAIVFKVSKLQELNFFDDRFILTAGDSDLIQRMLLTCNVIFIPEIISAYRVWQGALTKQKIATKLWLNEVDVWQDKIASLGKECYKYEPVKQNFEKNRDEVYASNLIAGIINKRISGSFFSAFSFFISVRFPWKARMKTKLQIFIVLLIS